MSQNLENGWWGEPDYPLVYGRDGDGHLDASEMKAIEDVCLEVQPFPPGHTMSDADMGPVKRYERDWMDWHLAPQNPYRPEELHNQLDRAVQSHLMGDVPYGLLIPVGSTRLWWRPWPCGMPNKGWTTTTLPKRGGPTYSFAIGLEAVPTSLPRKRWQNSSGPHTTA